MKSTLSLLLTIFTSMILYAQSPALINYQGIARNTVGNVLPNKTITLKLSVRDIHPTGAVIYSETRAIKTNPFGMFMIAIGSNGATNVQGSLSEINWKDGDKYLQVQIDPNGGWNYLEMGTTQLLSVPYALYANSASPIGPAGGILSGAYPSPTIGNGKITQSMLSPDISFPASGIAGGDLKDYYPNPTIKNNAITSLKIADNAVTSSKIANGSITAAKLAAGLIPSSLPPTGLAGGDLKGNYPSPTVNRIQGIPVSITAPSNGQVLKFNGTSWAPANDLTGGNGGGGGGGGNNQFTIPYSGSDNSNSNLFSLTNTGSGSAIEGIHTTNTQYGNAITGRIMSTNPGQYSSAIRGINDGTGAGGTGVWGSHEGYGKGVLGASVSGSGIHGESTDGPGIFGTSTRNAAGYFDISNSASTGDALFAYTVGTGTGMTAISENGNGIWAIAYNPFAAGLLAYNTGGGEAVVGQNSSSTAAAVVGKNNGTFAGVQGIAGSDGGIGVHALANQAGLLNGTALIAEVEGAADGNPAIFKANGANVARIDKTGKGFFNGGTQVGGADVAEFFDVEGTIQNYEPGDVLVISRDNDRTVEKSASSYSTLVAGVYATKPGIMLTEENAEADALKEKVPMGVIGVIPTKVCLEGGSIRRGDLIVTSSISGVAMKADPEKVKVGQVIGKALQDYNSCGIGKINVLVSIK